MIPTTWYKHIIISECDAVYSDHLAVCLLAYLVNRYEIHHENPIKTSYAGLQDSVNHLKSDICGSLRLLSKLQLISIQYPSNPHLLLKGNIAITLNIPRIEAITSNKFKNKASTSSVISARAGIVYVVKSENSNLFKIGRTTNINRRLKQLQSMNSGALSLIKQIKCHDAVATESALHQKFKAYRRAGSEWFQVPPYLLDGFIEFLANYQE